MLSSKPKGLTPLLTDIEKPYELPNELDHLCTFAGKCWLERTGNVGTRDPALQSHDVVLKVGLEPGDLLLPTGARPLSYACTPPLTVRTPRKLTPPRESGRVGKKIPVHQGGDHAISEYHIPDYALIESPPLQAMCRAVGGGGRMRNDLTLRVRRHKKNFPAVLALMKLRWMLRLHYALQSFGGLQCSLIRYLKGILADSNGVHIMPHSPLPHFDFIMESLKARMGQSFPFFLAYVATHDNTMPIRCVMPSVPEVRNGMHDSKVDAHIEQLIDDIFYVWLAQQKPAGFPVEAVLEELDYFGLERPMLRTTVPGLGSWVAAREMTKTRYAVAAQLEAHHLALLLDAPSFWPVAKHPKEDLLEMASHVVAHPRTFNTGVRERVRAALEKTSDTDPEGYPVPSLTKNVDDDLVGQFNTFQSSPRDSGRLGKLRIEKLRDKTSPRLVGNETRYSDVQKWHERVTKDLVLPAASQATLSVFSAASTPRIDMKVKMSATQYKVL